MAIISEHEQCARCGRKLKSEKSRKDGFGPVCMRKHNVDMEKAEKIAAEQKEYYESEAKAANGNDSNKQ